MAVIESSPLHSITPEVSNISSALTSDTASVGDIVGQTAKNANLAVLFGDTRRQFVSIVPAQIMPQFRSGISGEAEVAKIAQMLENITKLRVDRAAQCEAANDLIYSPTPSGANDPLFKKVA